MNEFMKAVALGLEGKALVFQSNNLAGMVTSTHTFADNFPFVLKDKMWLSPHFIGTLIKPTGER